MAQIQSDIIVLDSDARSTGTVQSAEYDLINMGGVQGTYEVLDFQSVVQIYNVDASNDQVQWDDGGGPYTASIPHGTYTQPEVNAAVKILMDAVGAPVYTFTVDPVTSLLDVATDTPNFKWEFGTIPLNGANYLLGLNPVNTVLAANFEGPLIPNVRTHTHILMNILQDGTKDVTILSGVEYSLAIPLDVEFGSLLSARKLVNFQQNISFTSNLSQLNITMSTEDGVPLLNPPRYVLMIRKLF